MLVPGHNALNTALVEGRAPTPFPRCPWALGSQISPFPGRPSLRGKAVKDPLARFCGDSALGSGLDSDPIADMERCAINFRAMPRAWERAQERGGPIRTPDSESGVGLYIAGKRESRRLLGMLVLTGDDFRTNRVSCNGCFPCSSASDLHSPEPAYQQGHEGLEFIAQSTHWHRLYLP